MRSSDDQRKPPTLRNEIPDFEGAPTGLKGVKAPYSPRQQGDIQDRLMAAGVYKPGTYELKKNN